jgi:SAM-dependent methyltransferase
MPRRVPCASHDRQSSDLSESRAVPPPLDLACIHGFLLFWLDNAVLPDAEQRAFDDYYRSYKRHFGPYVRACYARQTKELLALIEKMGRPRLLEAGCGCGTESLFAAIKGAEVTGIDIVPELLSVAECRKRYLEERMGRGLSCAFRKCALTDLGASERFDIIFLEQAFHHLEPRRAVIDKLARLTAPGGRIIISDSNGWNPVLQAALFLQRGARTITLHDGAPVGNERITVPMALIAAFRAHGFAVESLEYFRVLPNVKAADLFYFPDRRLPQFLRPLFTHYNLVLRERS